jgi:hypothetical protein
MFQTSNQETFQSRTSPVLAKWIKTSGLYLGGFRILSMSMAVEKGLTCTNDPASTAPFKLSRAIRGHREIRASQPLGRYEITQALGVPNDLFIIGLV